MTACLDDPDEIIPCWAFDLFMTFVPLYICYIGLRYGLYPILKSHRNAQGGICISSQFLSAVMKDCISPDTRGTNFKNAVDSVARKVVVNVNTKKYRKQHEEPPVLAGSYKCSTGYTVISSRSDNGGDEDIEACGYANMTTNERKRLVKSVLNLNVKESFEHCGWSLRGSRVGMVHQHDSGTDIDTATEETWTLEGHVNPDGEAYWVESHVCNDKEVEEEILVYGKFATPSQFHGEYVTSTDGRRGTYNFVYLPLKSKEEQVDVPEVYVGVPLTR